MSEKYQVSSSPHVRAKDSTSRVMLYVLIALLPASLFGIYNFGYKALVLILVTIASCMASEWIFNKIVHKKNSLTDLSAVVTGLLLALNLPVNLPMVGSCYRRCFRNRNCKNAVWRSGTEFHEPGPWRTLFPFDRICRRYDKLQLQTV